MAVLARGHTRPDLKTREEAELAFRELSLKSVSSRNNKGPSALDLSAGLDEGKPSSAMGGLRRLFDRSQQPASRADTPLTVAPSAVSGSCASPKPAAGVRDSVPGSRSSLRRCKTVDERTLNKFVQGGVLPWASGSGSGGMSCPESMKRSLWCVDDYVILKRLYTSDSSRVYKAQCKNSGEIIALKCYIKQKLHPINHIQVQREIRIHSSLAHPNIINLYGSFEDDKYYFLVQEYAEGGDLFDEIRRHDSFMPESTVLSLMVRPMLSALDYIHGEGVIHRDLKPENVLLTKGLTLKIADFGLAVNQEEERPVTRAGTTQYMSPEVLKNPRKRNHEDGKDDPTLYYDEKVDTWAVAVMAYEMLYGFPAFGTNEDPHLQARIFKMEVDFPKERVLSEACKDFLLKSLSKDPTGRYTASDLMFHSWVQQHRLGERRTSLAQRPGLKSSIKSGASSPTRHSVEICEEQPRAQEAHTSKETALPRTRNTSGSHGLQRRTTAPNLEALLARTGSSTPKASHSADRSADRLQDSFATAATAPLVKRLTHSRPSFEVRCGRKPSNLQVPELPDISPPSTPPSIRVARSSVPASPLSAGTSLPIRRSYEAGLGSPKPPSSRSSLDSPSSLRKPYSRGFLHQ